MKNKKKIITGIYEIAHKTNGRSYVGQSHDIHERWKGHIKDGGSAAKRKMTIVKAIRKYGPDAFEYRILEVCDPKIEQDSLDAAEERWIAKLDTFRNGYNERTAANGGLLSEAAKQKISDALKGVPWEEERKQAYNSHPNVIAARKKGGMSNSGQKRSEEFREKCRSHIRSDETRAKISKIHKGKPKSEEQKKKMSEAQKGRSLKPEHVAALKAAWIRRREKEAAGMLMPVPTDARGRFTKIEKVQEEQTG